MHQIYPNTIKHNGADTYEFTVEQRLMQTTRSHGLKTRSPTVLYWPQLTNDKRPLSFRDYRAAQITRLPTNNQAVVQLENIPRLENALLPEQQFTVTCTCGKTQNCIVTVVITVDKYSIDTTQSGGHCL